MPKTIVYKEEEDGKGTIESEKRRGRNKNRQGGKMRNAEIEGVEEENSQEMQTKHTI